MTYPEPVRTAARSLASWSSSVPGVPPARHRAPPRRLLTAIALVALTGAGCSNAPAKTGGGGENPATTGSPSTELRKKLPEYAKCMRENGIRDFLDPGADGTIQYHGNPDPVKFKSASEKCHDLLPEGRDR